MSSKPTVIIVPGSFHPASCMELLIDRLKEFDFKAEAVTLTTVGNFDNDVTDDEVFLKSVLMAHIANGEDVLLMLHSYAGLPGTRAIAGIDKRGREARGEQGGVLGVVYLAAFVPPESREKWDELGYKLPPWLKINETEGFISPANELETFYNDCDIGLAEATAKTLQRHSLKAIGALYSTEGALGVNEDGYDGRRAYIRCQLDNAMPVAAQEAFTALSKVKWITKDLQTSHSPFLSQPRQTAKVISELADEFLTAP